MRFNKNQLLYKNLTALFFFSPQIPIPIKKFELGRNTDGCLSSCEDFHLEFATPLAIKHNVPQRIRNRLDRDKIERIGFD